ncbi:hypothetical protein C0995_006166 [Termitomyces sp. Mi166|nr:hypothetical protein C0995_006166 [Termitomyces sp. Mi166\
MAVYLDEFTIQETFLDGIPAEMHHALICDDNLSPEVNTVTKFLAYAIHYEQSAHTATHYDQRSSCHAQGHRQPVKVGTFLAKCSEMEQNRNPRFAVQHRLPAGQRPKLGLTGNAPVAKESWYMLGADQPEPKGVWDGLPRVSPSKVAFGSGDMGYKLSGGVSQCYNCSQTGHYAKDCKVLRAQVQAAHMEATNSNVESNAEEDQEELVDNKEAPPEVEGLEGDDDADSVHIDGDEYVTVDVYDNEYYAHDDEEEHLFALTEHQGDKHVRMRRVTLQKAADKLQQPQYTPQEKECLVTYVKVNGHPAWTLWDSGSTTTGITPQFAHVNSICIHELTEPLMLQLGTVGSRAVVQFSAEVKIKMLGHLTKEYVDIANFDHYDMIIGMPFMHKNKVTLDFVNNEVIVNGMLLRAKRIVLADMNGCLQRYRATEKHRRRNVMVDDGDEKLAPMASLLANLLAVLMSEEEFQGTLERGDGPDQPISIGRKVVKRPDKAHLPKKTHVERVGVDLLECQPTSSRMKVEDLITDEVEEQQSAVSMVEMTDSIQSFWDQPVPPLDMQWAYDLCMPPEWNEVVASMVVHNWAGSC